jgi:predicted metal-binding protein
MQKQRKPSEGKDREAIGKFIARASELGAKSAKRVNPADVVTDDWVRWKCQFGCSGYGSSLVCPPYTPKPEETRRMLAGYRLGILFECDRGQAKRIAAALERDIFLLDYYKAFGLGAGPCRLCSDCALEEGCRYPDEARPSMEACGIDVYATARKQGFTINVLRDDADPQHYFGLVLIE